VLFRTLGAPADPVVAPDGVPQPVIKRVAASSRPAPNTVIKDL